LIFHIHFDLVRCLGVPDSKRGVDCDGGVIGIAAGAEEGAYYAGLVRRSAGTVVEDAEEGLRLNDNGEGGGRGLDRCGGGAKRARQMKGRVYFDHLCGCAVADEVNVYVVVEWDVVAIQSCSRSLVRAQ